MIVAMCDYDSRMIVMVIKDEFKRLIEISERKK